MDYLLDQLKPLTTEQYDKCWTIAATRIAKRVGSRPTRQQFQRELGSLLTILDVLAIVIFFPALVVSSIHIIAHMGKLAEASYITVSHPTSGSIISRDLYVAAHQWMLIPMAEGSMILFLVMFGMADKNWRKWVYFALAVVAVTFVLVANIQSGIGWLESLLAPIFTIGIGLKLELLIVQTLQRREEVNRRYLEALEVWEVATQDATQHPEFVHVLRQEIWQKLVSLKANQEFVDAPAIFKREAVRRELERERWTYDDPNVVSVSHNLSRGDVTLTHPFGNTHLIRDGDESTGIVPNANGHIADARP